MKTVKNPFPVRGYLGKDYFCNRKDEIERLLKNTENGINTTLLSLRRMGKTVLIYRFFEEIKAKKAAESVYVDVLPTQNQVDFVNIFATAILKVFPQHQSLGKKFTTFLKGFSPLISYDPISGLPQISFTFSANQKAETTLLGLMQFLERQKHPIVVAFDEFQQIAKYPEKNTETLLRTIIQDLKNVSFIFSGSHKHLLIEMFNSAKRPFFSATEMMHLDRIDTEEYADFIERLFLKKNKHIDRESIAFILDWTRVHTYYTQAVCNKVFSLAGKKITIDEVKQACYQLIGEQENVFYQYRKLLTQAQWNLLVAIAKEDSVYHPTSAGFIQQYHLGNASSVKRSLDALLHKEMVVEQNDRHTHFYSVYDCFLSRWLSRLNP